MGAPFTPRIGGPGNMGIRPGQPFQSFSQPRVMAQGPRLGPGGVGGRLGPVGPLSLGQMRGFVSQRPPVGGFGRQPGVTFGNGARINQFRNGPLGSSFRTMTGQFGRPGNQSSFLPRTGRNGWSGREGNREWNNWNHRHPGHGRFDRDRDRFFFNHFRHNFVNNDFFYGFYLGFPFWGAFSYPGYYPSIYSYWGWTPGWIYPSEGYYQPLYQYSYPTYDYYGEAAPAPEGVPVPEGAPIAPGPPVAGAPQPALDTAGVAQTIEDIRKAWLNGTIDPIAAHVSNQMDVQYLLRQQVPLYDPPQRFHHDDPG